MPADIVLDEAAEIALNSTLSSVRGLQEDNTALKSNFESLKDLYVKQSTALQELQGQHARLQQERVDVESQYQQLCQSWKLELEEKHAAFEDARSQILQPRDLASLKLRLMSEIEAPYKSKCELLAREAEVAQEAVVTLRRDYEELRARHNAQDLHQATQTQSLRSEHDAAVKDLQQQVASAAARAATIPDLQASLAALSRERDELRIHADSVTGEVEQLRAAAQKSNLEAYRAAVSMKAQFSEGHVVELQSQVEGLAQKSQSLEGALRDEQAAYAALQRRHEELRSEAESNSLKLDAARHEEAGRERDARDRLQRLQQQYEREVAALRRELQVQEAHLQAAQEKLEVGLARQQRTAESEQAIVISALQSELTEARDRATRLEAQAATMAAARAQTSTEHTQTQERLQMLHEAVRREKDAATEELSRCRREAGQLECRLAAREQALETAEAQERATQQLVERLRDELRAAASAVREAEDGRDAALDDCATLKGRIRSVQCELDAEVSKRCELVDATRTAWEAERTELVRAAAQRTAAEHRKLLLERKRARDALQRSKRQVVTLMQDVAQQAAHIQALEAGGAASGSGTGAGPVVAPTGPGAAERPASLYSSLEVQDLDGSLATMLEGMQDISTRQDAYLRGADPGVRVSGCAA